jgi:[ribosomal protein S5]-alanine N-acetyltransferase
VGLLGDGLPLPGLGAEQAPQTQEFVDQAITAWQVRPQQRCVGVAELSQAVVGIGELKIHSREWQQGEISFAVQIQRWNEGIATAIATQLLAYAIQSLGMHRVIGTCDPRNLASDAVLRKIGMTFEGRLWHTIKRRDGWRDSNLYSMLSHE